MNSVTVRDLLYNKKSVRVSMHETLFLIMAYNIDAIVLFVYKVPWAEDMCCPDEVTACYENDAIFAPNLTCIWYCCMRQKILTYIILTAPLVSILALNQLQFCDTAGHIKVNSFMPQYYRKARLILLVYSRDDDGTLRALDNWIDNAKKFLQDTRSSYSFCLVGLYSSHFLELHPPLTYDEKKVTQETLDNFLSHHYLNENLIFEVNLDTKEGLEELLMKLGRATKKLKSAPVGEVSTFTLSDTFDTTTATNVSQSGTPVKLQSASRKGPDTDSERCC